MSNVINISAGIPGRDQLELTLKMQNDEIQMTEWRVLGCPEVLKLVDEWRSRFTGKLADLPLPDSNTHAAILMRELILKAQGRWKLPYQEAELCHCRAIPTQNVDEAIVCGAHSERAVSRQTSAGTACGTCKPDITSLLEYRLVKRGSP